MRNCLLRAGAARRVALLLCLAAPWAAAPGRAGEPAAHAETRAVRASGPANQGETTWTEPTTGLEFVLLRGECYQMGQSEAEKRYLVQEYGSREYTKLYADESPHQVCVDDFWLARYETTNRQFRLFRPEHHSPAFRGLSMDDERQPVVQVNWEAARDFAAWLSAKYRDRVFRLPSEAEWEMGCRAGTDTPRFWGWGWDSDQTCRFANVHDQSSARANPFGWPPHNCDDGFVLTAPVGSLAPNPAGLYDMLGNVWEWTQDVYRADSYREHGLYNPVLKEGGPVRVRRGGSWNNEPGAIRCANRSGREAASPNNRTGFRLLMQVNKPENPPPATLSSPLLSLAELELRPERNSYKFKFTNPAAAGYALVISSPAPPREKSPDYSDISVSLTVFDGNQQLLTRNSAPLVGRFGETGADEYGAYLVSYRVPADLPAGKRLTASVEISGNLVDFLARRGKSKLALIPVP